MKKILLTLCMCILFCFFSMSSLAASRSSPENVNQNSKNDIIGLYETEAVVN